MKQALRIIFASALATAAVIKAVPALAEAAPAQSVSIVRTADLDLSTRDGRQALDRRLVTAASEVCGEGADVDLAGQNDVRSCRKDVLAQARVKTGAIVAGRTAERTILIAAR
jgi:UrcA family protein